MIKILYIILFSLIVANCSFKKVVKHHGVPFLEKKQASLIINKSNKNDTKKILGSPSTTGKFDTDVWIYIERKQTQSQLKNLGKMKVFKNDVLVLDFDKYGILLNKEFYNIDNMKKIDKVKTTTKAGFDRKSFIYDIFSSMRQKMNDPLGKRVKEREKINQR